MRAAIYARVSTGKQAEADLSIPDQIQQCQEYAARHGWAVEKEFIDAGWSATTDNRPDFQAMIAEAAAQHRPFDVILVHSQSRFARNTLDLLHYTRLLEKKDVRFISITQDLGEGDASDTLRVMLGAMDEYQSRETSKHVSRSMIENARQGYWNGAAPPFGYMTVAAGQKGARTKKRLAIDPREAEIVKRIFQLYVHGDGKSAPLGVTQTARHVNELGYVTRQGRPFRAQFIQKILRNTAYITYHYFNRYDKKKGKDRPREEWVRLESPRIVDDALFYAAPDRLEQNRFDETPPRIVNSDILLTGLATCTSCNSPLRIQTGKGGRYKYYKCSRKADHGGTVCSGCSIRMERLDEVVIEALLERVLHPERLETLLAELLRRRQERGKDIAKRKKALEDDVKAIDRKMKNLFEAVADGDMAGDSAFKAVVNKLRTKRENLLRSLGELERRKDGLRQEITTETRQGFAKAIRAKLFDPSNLKLARPYVRSIVRSVEVSDQEIRISGPKEALVDGLEAYAGGNEVVPTFEQRWRTGEDSNPRPLDS